jgi:hypothetical protein
MRVLGRGTGIAVGLAAVLALGGCGDDKKKESSSGTTVAPATTTTLSQAQLDKQKAQRILLTAADLPGYTATPPDPSDKDTPELDAATADCLNHNAVLKQLGEDNDPRGASTEDFDKGDTVTVSSSVTFGDTDDQARTAIADVSAPTVATCLARAFAADLKKDTTLSNVSVTGSKLPALTVGDQNAGYRMVAKFRTQGTNATVNFDFTFLRVGRAFAVLEASSFAQVFPETERVRLATVLTGRMAGP